MLALLISLIQHSTFPNPFRFYAPKRRSWLPVWINEALNTRILNNMNLQGPPDYVGIAALRELLFTTSPQHPAIVVPAHVGFADPHVIQKWLFESPDLNSHQLSWMAGIEAFEKSFGFAALILTHNQTYSVDRGVLDRASLQYTQHHLKTGTTPLVMFIEGEANFREDSLGPCQPGVAQLGLKALQNGVAQDIRFLPVSFHYPCIPRDSAWYAALYQTTLGKWQAHFKTSLPPWDAALPMPAQALRLIDSALEYLWQQSSPKVSPPTSLAEKALALIHHLGLQLADTHGFVAEDVAALSEVASALEVKNRWRSTIARNVFAPKQAWLDTYRHQLQHWQVHPPKSRWTLGVLARLERTLLGQPEPNAPVEKRLQSLLRHLDRLTPYATQRQQASASLIAQWHRDMLTCRQIKLLHLLREASQYEQTTPEAWDAVRLVCHLLLTHQFWYPTPKRMQLRVANPLVLSAADPELPTPAALTGELSQALMGLMGTGHRCH